MMKNYTASELASDRALWEEYIDPDNNAPYEDFTQAERTALIIETFDADFDAQGNPAEADDE